MGIISEKSVYIFLFLILAFMWLTFNRDIASIYGMFLILDYIIFDMYGNSLKYKINGIAGNSMMAMVYGALAVVIFLGISFLISTFLQSAVPILKGNFMEHYLKIFAQTTPLLAGNKILTLIGWGLVIPIIETRLFFGRLFDIVINATNTTTSYFNSRLLVVIIVISTLFTYFHFSVRGLSDNVALMGTFIFAALSLSMVYYFKELESPSYFHVFWNSYVTYKNLWI